MQKNQADKSAGGCCKQQDKTKTSKCTLQDKTKTCKCKPLQAPRPNTSPAGKYPNKSLPGKCTLQDKTKTCKCKPPVAPRPNTSPPGKYLNTSPPGKDPNTSPPGKDQNQPPPEYTSIQSIERPGALAGMSGQEFLETLKQIGYPKADSLNARSFDWMFEDEVVWPFLSWFVGTVNHQNVLSGEEQNLYEEIDLSPSGVLEGPFLEEALNCLSASTTQDDNSVETLQEDVERLSDDLHRYKKRKERLIKARNSQSMHNAGLAHKLSKLTDLEASNKQQYRHTLEKCYRANAESNASLQRLGESVQRLCSLYEDHGESEHREVSGHERDKVFLSQVGLDAFHRAEDVYSRDLTFFTKRLFFEGISDIAGGEVSRYQLLEISDPNFTLIKGPSQITFQQDCQELTRLQALFPRSEGERLNALVQAECAASVSQAADEILRNIHLGHFPKDVQTITQQLQEVKYEFNSKKEELRQLTEEVVPSLVRELGTLQGNSILTGNYHLKLARQDYFTNNQDQVLKYLVEQRARNEFLTMAYEVEARSHRDVHRLLTAVQQTLKDRLAKYEARMKAMADPGLTKAKYERGTIDTRDTATTRLHQMLVPEPKEKQLFLSYSSIVQHAETLKHSHDKAKADTDMTVEKYNSKVFSLEKEVDRCNATLYADSSTMGGQPAMMPTQLREMTNELNSLLHKLEAAVVDVVNDINTKKKSLRKDPLMVKERQLFVYFHTKPEQLQKMVQLIEERLNAKEVR